MLNKKYVYGNAYTSPTYEIDEKGYHYGNA